MVEPSDTLPLPPCDPDDLRKLVRWTMPFGRYAGRSLIELPEPYLVWFSRQGFPRGKLGELLQLTLEIKINGLETLFQHIDPEPDPPQRTDEGS